MKGLILKDLYQCVRYYKSYVVLIIVFLASSIGNDSLFFFFYPCIIAGMIPPSLLAYDERNKWDLYCGTLPVTRAQVVSAKYLIGLLVQGFILLASGVFHGVLMSVRGTFSLQALGTMLAMMVTASGFSSSITLPFMFKLGVEKGRMAYYVTIGLTCGGIAFASSALASSLQELAVSELPAYLAALAACGLYVLSWLLSIRFYEKRELH
jgi:hypothetical protein